MNKFFNIIFSLTVLVFHDMNIAITLSQQL